VSHYFRTYALLPVLAAAVLLVSSGMAGLDAQQAPPAAGPTLTLDEAILRARQNNPDFQIQLSDIGVARWQLRSSQASLLPSASFSNTFGYTASGERRFDSIELGQQPAIYSSSFSLGASLDVNGTRLLQPSVARANLRATEQRVAGAEATLEANVAQQYLAVLRAEENVAQAEREVARTAEHVRLAQARLDVGAGTPLDVRRAEVQKGQADISLVQAQATQANAILQLGQAIGDPLPIDVRLASDFTLFQPAWQPEELTALALRNNPTLLAARASAEAAGTSMRQAQSAYLPSLRFDVGATGNAFRASGLEGLIQDGVQQGIESAERTFLQCQEQNQIRQGAGLDAVPCVMPPSSQLEQQVRGRLESQYGTFPFDYQRQPMTARMTVSLPIFTGLARQLQVEQARTNAIDARHQVRAQELRLQTDVAVALRNLQTAHRTVELHEIVRAAAAEELRLAEERFRFGAASSIEVTDAQTRLAETERAQIDAVYNFHQSLAALEALVGQTLR
jgi:outer membrane protein